MGIEEIAKIEFLPMIACWGCMYALVYRKIKDPVKLQYMEDVIEREKIRANYLNNYISISHAILMCILSKSNSANQLGLACILIYPNTPDREMMPLEAFTFRLSISYLIFDSFFGFYKGYNDYFMLFHHGIMLSVFLYALYM